MILFILVANKQTCDKSVEHVYDSAESVKEAVRFENARPLLVCKKRDETPQMIQR
jgi:hypothetical protein